MQKIEFKIEETTVESSKSDCDQTTLAQNETLEALKANLVM